MRFLNINVSKELTGKKVGRTKIPIFVISLLGKHTPDFVYSYIVKRITLTMAQAEIGDKDELERFFKELVQLLVNILKDSTNDPQLEKYDGIIAEFVGGGEVVVVSIS